MPNHPVTAAAPVSKTKRGSNRSVRELDEDEHADKRRDLQAEGGWLVIFEMQRHDKRAQQRYVDDDRQHDKPVWQRYPIGKPDPEQGKGEIDAQGIGGEPLAPVVAVSGLIQKSIA